MLPHICAHIAWCQWHCACDNSDNALNEAGLEWNDGSPTKSLNMHPKVYFEIFHTQTHNYWPGRVSLVDGGGDADVVFVSIVVCLFDAATASSYPNLNAIVDWMDPSSTRGKRELRVEAPCRIENGDCGALQESFFESGSVGQFMMWSIL